MTTKTLPCPTLLRQLLRYEPETGKLFWKKRHPWQFSNGLKITATHACNTWNSRYSGLEALAHNNDKGYKSGSVNGVFISAHRVVWSVYHGSHAEDFMDHINGDRADNRIGNLRVVTNRENSKNSAMSIRNKSGHSGIFWDNRRMSWTVTIGSGESRKSLGAFKDISVAVEVRKRAEHEEGYHENHGRPRACLKA